MSWAKNSDADTLAVVQHLCGFMAYRPECIFFYFSDLKLSIQKVLQNIQMIFQIVSSRNTKNIIAASNFKIKMVPMRIFSAVGIFSSFDVRFNRKNHQTIPSETEIRKIWENFKNRRKYENNYQFLRCCFINPVHNWDNLSQLFCLSRLLNFVRPHNAPRYETTA